MTTSRSRSIGPVSRSGCVGWLSDGSLRHARRNRGGILRILLVEDDQMNVELFESALETDGHEVVTERDGLAGEQRASEEFDVVLLDIQLPKKDGLQVCRSLRARGLRVPLVALSASVLLEEV